MPFNIELRAGVSPDRRIKTLHGVALPLGVIEERRSEFPLLRGIDPYSDTYFGQLQMKDLFSELAELAADLDGDVRDTLEGVIELARRGSEEPHYYLVFIGD